MSAHVGRKIRAPAAASVVAAAAAAPAAAAAAPAAVLQSAYRALWLRLRERVALQLGLARPGYPLIPEEAFLTGYFFFSGQQ